MLSTNRGKHVSSKTPPGFPDGAMNVKGRVMVYMALYRLPHTLFLSDARVTLPTNGAHRPSIYRPATLTVHRAGRPKTPPCVSTRAREIPAPPDTSAGRRPTVSTHPRFHSKQRLRLSPQFDVGKTVEAGRLRVYKSNRV